MKRMITAFTLVLAILACAAPALASLLDPAPQPPPGLSPECARIMQDRWAILERTRSGIEAAVAAHDAACSAVAENDWAAIDACTASGDEITAAVDTYLDDVTVYVDDLDAAAVAASMDEELRAAETELARIKRQLQSARAEMRRVSGRIADYQALVDDWLSLSSKARKEARATARSAAFDILFDKAADYLSGKALTASERAMAKLRRAEELIARRNTSLVRTVRYNIKGAHGSAESAAALLDYLRHYKRSLTGQMAAAQAFSAKEREEILDNLLQATVILCDPFVPVASPLMRSLKTLSAGAYGWAGYLQARKHVERFMELGEQDTAILAKATEHYMDLVAKHKEARSELETLRGMAASMSAPPCGHLSQ